MLYWISVLSALALQAKADVYRFTITSNDLTAINAAKNCIDYSLCEDPATSINTEARRMHVRVNLETDAKAIRVFQNCNLTQYGADATLTNESQNKNLSVQVESNPRLLANPQVQVKNVFTPILSTEEKSKFNRDVDTLLGEKKNNEAMQLIIKTLNLDTYDYQVSIDEKPSGYAVTDHDKKTIRFDPAFFTDTCSLVRGLRHEFEHVGQWKRAVSCANKGLRHSFFDHVERERSAYLNDIANYSHYCANDYVVRYLVNSSWSDVQKKYMRQ